MAELYYPEYSIKPLAKLVVKYNGIYDFEGLMRLVSSWLSDRGYYFEEPTIKYKVPTPEGAEIEYIWTGWKKVTPYYKYWIRLYVHTFDLKDVEVIQNGQKFKRQKSQIYVEMNGEIEIDYSGRWKGHQYLQFMRQFMDRYFFRKEMFAYYGDQLWYHVYKLQTAIKEFFDMETKFSAYEDVW